MMPWLKVRSLFLLVSLFFTINTNGQPILPECGTEELLNKALQSPAYRQTHQQQEQAIYQQMSQLMNSGMAFRRAGGPYMIPVVVHIVHNGGPENISDAQVLNAIKNINDAFANIGYYDSLTGVATNIQFCLAKQTPQGTVTNGILRVQSPLTDLDMAQDLQMKALSRWNPLCYANIYIVKEICSQSSGCGVAGYAYYPSAHGGAVDGLVVEARYFGTSQANDAVGVHELGHYLGLRHTFQGGCTNNNCLNDGDNVCDTPPDQSTAPVNCAATANTCSTDAQSGFTSDQNDNFTNYMDYGFPSCYDMFTQGQTDRMHWHIDNVRYSLLNCISCNSPCTTNIVAQFSPSSGSATTVGTQVAFTNQSVNGSTYVWYLNGTQFSTAASPNYTFNTQGTYIIRLQATGVDANCIDFYTDTITVTCGVQASFTQSTTTVNLGGQITFTNTSTGGTSYDWYVDGVLVSNSSTTYTHTFNTNGVYPVYLIAHGAICSDTTSLVNFVHVGAPCAISFTYQPQQPTTCRSVTFTPDTNCLYSNYYWSFCQPANFGVPAIQQYNVTGPLPAGAKLLKDHNGNYHVFYVAYSTTLITNTVYRLEFGNSINNTPVLHTVSTPGINTAYAHGIDVVYDGGNYYGFGLYDNLIYRFDFGTTINNNPTVSQVTGIPANTFDWGMKMELVQESNLWWIVLVARNSSNLVVLYLGNNVAGAVQSVYSSPCQGCWGFNYQKVNGNHYMHVTSFQQGMRLMSFGNSLTNTPTAGAWATYGTGLHGDVALYQNCDGGFDGIILKETAATHTIFHLDSITATPTVVVNSFSGLPRTGSGGRILRTDAGLTMFAADAYGTKMGKLNFPDCGIAYSTSQFPPPVFYPQAGTYYVRLAVDEGLPTQQVYCQNITVTSPTPAQLDLGPDVITCVNGVFPLDAGPGFTTYLWDDNTTDQLRTVFNPGTYWVETTDSCNNIYRDTITITVDQATAITLNNPTICEGDSTTLTAPPGFANYAWTPTTAISCTTCPTVTVWPTDTTVYTLNARTANGCVNAASAIVSVADCDSTLPLTAVLSSLSVSCIGLSDGEAYVDVFGGVPPYQITWSTGETNDTVLNLLAGRYTVTVTDDAGTTSITDVFVGSPSQVIILTSSYTAQLDCAGDTTGGAKVHATGGTPPYTFSWSNGFSGDTPVNMSAGTHTVTATDGHACTATAQIIIRDGANLAAAQILGPDTVDSYVSAVFITDAGYNYSWTSNHGTTVGSANTNSATINWNSAEGTDTVQVIISVLGCIDTLYHPVVLLNLTSAHDMALRGIELYPNPSNGSVTVRAQVANAETELLMFDALGKQMLKRVVQPTTMQAGVELDMTMLSEGIYLLHLKTGAETKVLKVVRY